MTYSFEYVILYYRKGVNRVSKRKKRGGKVKIEVFQSVKLETVISLAAAIVNLITALILLRIALSG